MTKYALLYSGKSSRRHIDDLEFAYRVLTRKYEYAPDNIVVLNLNGRLDYIDEKKNEILSLSNANWPGDDTPYSMVIRGPGTHISLKSQLATMGEGLQSSDTLFIHTNNHGGNNGIIWSEPKDSYICTFDADKNDFDGEGYTEKQMAASLSAMKPFAQLIVMMEQCHGGGFKDTVCNNTMASKVSFAAAAKYSRGSVGTLVWDSFSKYWIEAASGKCPDGSALSNPPSSASVKNLFDYAKSHDKDGDTPVYRDMPEGVGETMFL
jgi:hypothetical protein